MILRIILIMIMMSSELEQLILQSYHEIILEQVSLPHYGNICITDQSVPSSLSQTISSHLLRIHNQTMLPMSPYLIVFYCSDSDLDLQKIDIDGRTVKVNRKSKFGHITVLDVFPYEIHRYFGISCQQGQQNQSSVYFEYANLVFQVSKLSISLCGFYQGGLVPITTALIQSINNQIPLIEGTLKLENQNIGISGVKEVVSRSQEWPELTVINLWWNNIGVQGAKQLAAGIFPALKVLDLRKNYIGDEGLKYLCQTHWNVSEILLSDNSLKNIAYEHFNSHNFPNISAIDLQNNNISDKNFYFSASKVVRLNLRSNLFTGKGFRELTLFNLTKLMLSGNQIVSCQFFACVELPALEFLSLYDNKISDVRWLRKMRCSPSQIWIHKNPVRVSFEIDGADLSRVEILRLSFFSNNSVISESLSWLAKHCPSLQKLNAKQKDRIACPKVLQKLIQKYMKVDLRMHEP